jgi:hypothetical protein
MVLNMLAVQILPAMTAAFITYLGPNSLPLWAYIHLKLPSLSLRTLQKNACSDNLFDFIGSLFLLKVLVKDVIVHIQTFSCKRWISCA